MTSSQLFKALRKRAREALISGAERSNRQRLMELPFFSLVPAILGAVLFKEHSLGLASGYLWVAALPIV